MIKKMFKSGYFKALAVLTSGSLIGALITGVAEIARTWIFPADLVGVYSFLLAFPHLFISIPTLRYDVSIVVEKDERKALALVKLCFVLLVTISAITTAAFTIYIFVFHPDYTAYWYTIPFAFIIVAGYGLNNILNSYNNRYKQYGEISRRYVIRTGVQRISALLLGLIVVVLLKLPQWSVLVMYAPHGIGLYVGAWNQSRGIRARADELKSITLAEMWEVAKYHKKQAYYSSPALFINSYSYTSITLQIESLFDTTTLAYYSISNRVLGMPIALICGNVAKVYIEEAAREYRDTGKFIKAFRRSLLFLVALAVPMFFAMRYLAPPVCELVLGKGWHVAGDYIKILALMFAFRLVGTALSQSLAVCNRQGVELIVNIGLVCASLLSGFITRHVGGDITFFLRCICLSRSLCYVGLILGVYLCARGSKNWKPAPALQTDDTVAEAIAEAEAVEDAVEQAEAEAEAEAAEAAAEAAAETAEETAEAAADAAGDALQSVSKPE